MKQSKGKPVPRIQEAVTRKQYPGSRKKWIWVAHLTNGKTRFVTRTADSSSLNGDLMLDDDTWKWLKRALKTSPKFEIEDGVVYSNDKEWAATGKERNPD